MDIQLCSEANKKGGFSIKFGTFGPSKLVASATSTPTTPTHAECLRVIASFISCFILVVIWASEIQLDYTDVCHGLLTMQGDIQWAFTRANTMVRHPFYCLLMWTARSIRMTAFGIANSRSVRSDAVCALLYGIRVSIRRIMNCLCNHVTGTYL